MLKSGIAGLLAAVIMLVHFVSTVLHAKGAILFSNLIFALYDPGVAEIFVKCVLAQHDEV